MWVQWLADLLSSARCAACNAGLSRASAIFCRACAATVVRCEPSQECFSFGQYGGALATAIRRFKYEDAAYLARPLGALLRAVCRSQVVRADVVMPVPLHPHRLAQRGYNQSALLAAHVAAELQKPLYAGVLMRCIDTAPQSTLCREARARNVVNAFRVARPQTVRGRAVLLVDDVATTGATLRACGECLLQEGVDRVTSLVVARALTQADEDRDFVRSPSILVARG